MAYPLRFSDAEIAWRTINDWLADRRTGLPANCRSSATRLPSLINAVDNPPKTSKNTCNYIGIPKCQQKQPLARAVLPTSAVLVQNSYSLSLRLFSLNKLNLQEL